jgi:hypothetical protein
MRRVAVWVARDPSRNERGPSDFEARDARSRRLDLPNTLLVRICGNGRSRARTDLWCEIGSVVIAGADPDQPGILVSVGLDDTALAGLSRAIRNPAHPIPRSAATRIATFDVMPTVPGGPALRSHLPLVITRNGSETVLGVLALAYDRPLDEPTRSILTAVADLAATVMEMSRRGRG